MAYGDDEDSPPASSENDGDENMEDMDDGDGDADAEVDADNEDENDNEDNEDDDEDPDEAQDNLDDTPTKPRQSHTDNQQSDNRVNGTRTGAGDGRYPQGSGALGPDDPYRTAPSTPNVYKPSMRMDAVNAVIYDIAPTIAAPHSTSINTVAATPDMRWVFSGGSDGWVRKFNWVDTANGKTLLTVAQRHPFVDSVTKAGVLMSYWENEDTLDKAPTTFGADEGPSLSPVYSLAVHHQALWLLSGTESGVINLQSVRHDEGKRITSLYKHTSAVSVMSLSYDELSMLSGSWDKNLYDWDLNIGQVKRSFVGSGGQISAIEIRPLLSVPIPRDLPEKMEPASAIATFSSNNDRKASLTEGAKANGSGLPSEGLGNTPSDSLFGNNEDNDSLFGDDDGTGGGENAFNEDDDEFAKVLNSGMQEQNSHEADGDVTMSNLDFRLSGLDDTQEGANQSFAEAFAAQKVDDSALTNGLPHAEELPQRLDNSAPTDEPLPPMSESTFLDAAIDGTLRIWDRRISSPVVRIPPSRNVPPWCMHACWSPDGNFIYAGRRNGTVDEYSLHKGFHEPRRSLRFPAGSGAVSAVRAMPNGRHLVCASHDILRLYDLKDDESAKPSTVPFLIVPGHRTGVVSQLYIDPTCSFMISTGGNRGWEGSSTEVMLGYEIGIAR